MRTVLAIVVLVVLTLSHREASAQAAAGLRPQAGTFRAVAALTPVAFRSPLAGERAAISSAVRGSRRTGEVLMIVGGAGFVAGLLADEDVLTISGAILGCYGLFLYLR